MPKAPKMIVFASCALAGIMLAAQAASAAKLRPGQYDLNGEEEICLKSDRTWYSTTYDDWSGRWVKGDDVVYIYGNWADGNGNSLITIAKPKKEPYKASWFQWRYGSKYRRAYPGTTVSFVGAVCDPPADARLSKRGGNPGD